ncbi:MAG: alpha/beta fold hydrolase [Paenisporosarcina sp.]
MKKTIHYVTMSDGQEIYTVVYAPEQDVRGHVHILHGMAEHIGRYEEFASFLTENGYLVSGHDHRGHGQTGQKQEQFGFFTEKGGFERVTEDVREILQAVRINIELPPPILFTHSMGTFIGRRYIQKYGHSISKIVLSGTRGPLSPVDKAGKWIAIGFAMFQGKKAENHVLNKMSFEKFNSAVSHPGTKFDWLSTDPKQVKNYIDDPLCGFIASNQFFVDLIDGLTKVNDMKEMKQIPKDLPILLISGALDPVGKMGKDLWTVAEQYKKLGVQDVKVVIMEGKRHELLNEVDNKEIYKKVLTWMEKK